MTTNPYAAPKAAVADATVTLEGDYVPGGQSRPAGNGWTWIAEGWTLFKRQPALWIGIMLLLFLIFLAAGVVPILNMVGGIFWPVFLGGIAVGCRVLHEGGELELAHLFAGFQQKFGTLLGVGALSLLLSMVIVFLVFAVMGFGMLRALGGAADAAALMSVGLTMLLAMLITLALLLPVVMLVWFAPLLVVFHDMGVWESMKESFAGCLKNIVPFLVYSVILLVLGLLALIPLGLGLLILWPVGAASIYTSYRDIYLKPRA